MSQLERDAEELALFLPNLKGKFAEILCNRDPLGRKITNRFGQPIDVWPQDARQVNLCVRKVFYVHPGNEDRWLTRFCGDINRSKVFKIEHTVSEDGRMNLYYVEDEVTGLAMGATAMMGVLARRAEEDFTLSAVCSRTKKALGLKHERVAAAIRTDQITPVYRGRSLALSSSMFFGKRM